MSPSEVIPDSISRRGFVRGAATVAAVASSAGVARAFDRFGPKHFVYVGTYPPNGKGIYLYEVNPVTGELKLVKLASNTPSPSFLVASESGRFLYAVNEVSNFQGTSGSVTAFAVDKQTGDLKLLNTVSSVGGGPVYLSLDRTGRFLFVANYGGGSIAVLPIQSDGALGNASDSHTDTGNVGPTTATNAPPGSFANSGHDAPHAHCIIRDLKNRFVLHTDLGQDRIYVYAFDAAAGRLTPAATPFVSVPPGDGARHLAFHPSGRWLYCTHEESSTILKFSYNESTGELIQQQLISGLPPGFEGTSYGAALQIAPSGRFLYTCNRLNDTITTFRLDFNGELHYVGETGTRGDYPREITLDPSGNFLYSCNQRADNVTAFLINPLTGLPKFIGQYTGVGAPASLTFLP